MRNLKIFALSLFVAVSMTVWGADANQEDEKYPEITFERTTIDFGLLDRKSVV